MRTDVKLGLVASVVVIALGSWYFFDQPRLGEAIPIGPETSASGSGGPSGSPGSLPLGKKSTNSPSFDSPTPSAFGLTGIDDPDVQSGLEIGSSDSQVNGGRGLGDVTDQDDPDLGELFTLGASPGGRASSLDLEIGTDADEGLQKFHSGAGGEPLDGGRKRSTPVKSPTREARPFVTHTVRSGDTLATISRMYFGDDAFASVIRNANRDIENWGALPIGKRLRIPENAEKPAVVPPRRENEKPKIPTSYSVESGDSLIAISRAIYGDGSKWWAIHARNKDQIGDDPGALKVGMVLVLPTLDEIASMPNKTNRSQ